MDSINYQYSSNRQSITNIPATVNKLSKSAGAGLDNSPKVLQIQDDISLGSPAKEKIRLLCSES